MKKIRFPDINKKIKKLDLEEIVIFKPLTSLAKQVASFLEKFGSVNIYKMLAISETFLLFFQSSLFPKVF